MNEIILNQIPHDCIWWSQWHLNLMWTGTGTLTVVPKCVDHNLSHLARYQTIAGKGTARSATFMCSASAQVIIKPSKKEWATNTCCHCSTRVACQVQVLLPTSSPREPMQLSSTRSSHLWHHHILASEKGGNVWSFELRAAEHSENITCKGATVTSKGVHDCNVPESTRAVFCSTSELTKHDIITWNVAGQSSYKRSTQCTGRDITLFHSLSCHIFFTLASSSSLSFRPWQWLALWIPSTRKALCWCLLHRWRQ